MTKIERLLRQHYQDMLKLTKETIQMNRRPQVPMINSAQNDSKSKRKLTKKQLAALAQGRKKLAAKRGKIIQI